MDIVKVTFNDNTVHEYKKGTLFYDASKDFDMENIVGYKINNEVFSLDNKLLEDVKVDFINTNDLIGNRIYKAGLKFLFLVSLQEVFNDFDVVYEHSVPRGMLGVLKGPRVLSHEDISKIKARMCKLISDNEIITKLNVSAKDAIKYFNDKKVEIRVISGDNPVTVSSIAKQVGIKEYEKYIDCRRFSYL